ncbi:MAG: hypothetical protein K2H23_04145 [Oscillospiraceae bacterium]|nr:hypothetical protein [Oscillospiraceae bacterium]
MKNILYKIFSYSGVFLIGVLLVPASVFLLMIKLVWHCMDTVLEKLK